MSDKREELLKEARMLQAKAHFQTGLVLREAAEAERDAVRSMSERLRKGRPLALVAGWGEVIPFPGRRRMVPHRWR